MAAGGAGGAGRIDPAGYGELRRIAAHYLRQERRGHTLQTSALVNEAFLRLVDQPVDWRNRAQFFGIAARLMRQILVDHARHRGRAMAKATNRAGHLRRVAPQMIGPK